MENNEKKKVLQKDRTISFFLVVAGLAGFLVAVAFDLKAVMTVILKMGQKRDPFLYGTLRKVGFGNSFAYKLYIPA